MTKCSFKLESDDNKMIERQMGLIGNMQSQIEQMRRQMQKEVDFCNTIYRAAVAEAKLADEKLREVDVPKLMIHPDGRLAVEIRDGVVSWTLPDEGEGEAKDEESDEG